MSDPQFQLAGQAKAQEEGLWTKAPGWRNLTIAAALLTTVAVALPLSLPSGDVTAASSPPITPPAPVATAAPALPAPMPAPAPAPTIIVNPTPVRVVVQQPAPQAQPLPQQQACMLVAPQTPRPTGVGVVRSFEDQQVSLARIRRTQGQVGGAIDPDYMYLQRVVVDVGNGPAQVFIVPKNLVVQVGDKVSLQALFRNQALPCNYIPGLITADYGPTQQAAAKKTDAINVDVTTTSGEVLVPPLVR